MRAILATVGCLVMAVWSACAESRMTRNEAPGILYSRVRDDPYGFWVSAHELTQGGGKIRWELLGKDAAEDWRRTLPVLAQLETKGASIQEVSEENCKVFTSEFPWTRVDEFLKDDFSTFVKTAKEVFSGRVVAHTPGFLGGVPVTALTVEVTEGLRFEPPAHERSVIYLAYPHAYFAMDGYVFCGVHEVGPDPPAVGSRILILYHGEPIDKAGSMLMVSVQEVVSASGEGVLTLPSDLKQSPALRGVSSFEEVLELVRAALAVEPGATGTSNPVELTNRAPASSGPTDRLVSLPEPATAGWQSKTPRQHANNVRRSP